MFIVSVLVVLLGWYLLMLGACSIYTKGIACIATVILKKELPASTSVANHLHQAWVGGALLFFGMMGVIKWW